MLLKVDIERKSNCRQFNKGKYHNIYVVTVRDQDYKKQGDQKSKLTFFFSLFFKKTF